MALQFKIAETKEELEQALELREAFMRRVQPRALEEKDEFDGLAGTVHFIALEDSLVVGTVRLVEDSEKGLPLEELVDLSPYRGRGRKLAKVSKLLVLPEERHRGRTLLGLVKVVYQYVKKKGITDLYITPNLEVVPIFEKLGFEPLGEKRFYERFNVEIMPMHLKIKEAEEGLKLKKSRLFSFLSEEPGRGS